MLGSIYVGLSGMEAYQKGLQTISNNVSNLNTVGYKSTSASFSDVFNKGGEGLSYSDSNSGYVGDGVKFGTPIVDFTQGDLRQTSGDLDLGIQGSGFLVLLGPDNALSYARTGQFSVGEDGYISLQGTDQHLAILDPSGKAIAVNLDGKRTSTPTATTTVKFADILSSGATSSTVTGVAVYDSIGAKQIWTITFTPVGTTAPDNYNVAVTDQTGRTVGTSVLKFIGNTVDPSTNKLTITDSPPGAAPLSVVLDFSQGVNSFSAGPTSSLRASSTDGNGVGVLTSVTVDTVGRVKLAYSNAKTDFLGPVALADFRTPQDLERVGSGLFRNTKSSQHRLIGSGADGAGKVVSRQLEASNVDLSESFGELILIQRGFQASSQVVSVANDMIQQLFGIRGQG